MQIAVIDGVTRVIGESQGYLGLPLRDVVINDSVNGPGMPAMQSAWEPSTAEIAILARGGTLVLTVLGTAHPPVMLEVAEASTKTSSAMVDVIAERLRQVSEEGFGPEHDDRHRSGELARAAACYAIGIPAADLWPWLDYVDMQGPRGDAPVWELEMLWWKPTTARRNLVKAAALILAEIERIDREDARAAASSGEAE